MAYKIGDKTEPCLTSYFTGNGSENAALAATNHNMHKAIKEQTECNSQAKKLQQLHKCTSLNYSLQPAPNTNTDYSLSLAA